MNPQPSTETFIASHSFTPYMRSILQQLHMLPKGARVLDIPAGRGQFSDALRQLGMEVVSADLNGLREDYLAIDMSQALPLETSSFDVVVCTEGLEHMLAPHELVLELLRVTRPGGYLFLSVPNIHNFYSRLQFLFTGTFFQFQAFDVADTPLNHSGDRGHVSPVSLPQLRWWLHLGGGKIEELLPDKEKRRFLKPFYWLLHQLGRPWRNQLRRKAGQEFAQRNRELRALLESPRLRYARSLVVCVRKHQ